MASSQLMKQDTFVSIVIGVLMLIGLLIIPITAIAYQPEDNKITCVGKC